MTSNTPKPHVVVIPSPGMGHLIPLVEFSKLLHFNHHFSITLLLPSSTPPTTALTTFLSTLPPSIHHTFLPQVNPTLIPPNLDHVVSIHLINYHSLTVYKTTLASLSGVVAVVTDLFGTDYFDAAIELGISPYLYFTTNAFCLLFQLNLPTLHETVSYEYRDMKDPLILPGCVPLYPKDFVDPVQDRKGEPYKVFLYHIKRYALAKSTFINTFLDLEPGALNGLKTKSSKVYPVGPVTRSDLGGELDEGLECLTWLDGQPYGSVLFVSFGSWESLSYEQTIELALGLEKSGQRFLWVVRPPYDSNLGNNENPFGFLPKGFLDRVKDRGFLIPQWGPQVRVLAHASTGGFLTHCGWNSTLESIVNGVPLIAWPLYAEQKMNAVMLNEGLKVALRPKTVENNGIIKADGVARVVNELMVGGEGLVVRQRMKEFSELAKKARSEDGYSTKTLNQVVQEWNVK